MKKFKFKLETKLRLTVQEEKQALWEYRTRQNEWLSEQEILEKYRQQLVDLWEYYREIIRKGTGIQKLIMIQQFVPVLKERISNQEVRLEAARVLMQEAETIYLNLRMERKTLDKLKDREHQQYLLEWQREEQKLIDEIASNGFGRHKMTAAGE